MAAWPAPRPLKSRGNMNLKRTLTIALVGGAAVVWSWAAMTPAQPFRSTPEPIAPGPLDARGVELAREIARLRERLRPGQAPRERDRNPFRFRPSPPRQPVASPSPSSPASDAAPAEPLLTLAGLAEDVPPHAGPLDPGSSATPVRIAIISAGGELFLVKAGEQVTDRYRVAAVSADGVELIDLTTDTTRRLTLK